MNKKPDAKDGSGVASTETKASRANTTPAAGRAQSAPAAQPPSTPTPPVAAPPPPDQKPVTPEDQQRAQKLVEKARDQLNDGQNDVAQETLRSALMIDPHNETALSFSRQLNEDPLTILNAATSHPDKAKLCDYKVISGDSLSKIAERAYGGGEMRNDLRKTLFVSLARLNQLAVPKSVKPGQTVKVPAVDCSKLVARKSPSQPPPEKKTPSTSAPPVTDPSPDYTAAMIALQEGNKARAFSLLKRAIDSDPSNRRAKEQYADLVRARDAAYSQCANARAERNYKATVTYCDQVLAIEPGHELAQRYKNEAQRLMSVN